VKFKETALTTHQHNRLRLLDTATKSGSLDDLTILCSGSGIGIGLGLLDINHGDSIL